MQDTDSHNESPSKTNTTADQESGVGYLITAAIVGMLIGGTLGFFIAWGVAGVFISILATVGGAMVGGAAGGLLGERLHHHDKKGD